MAMVTFFSNTEQTDLKDKELQNLLGELNKADDGKWLIEEREVKPFLRSPRYFYTLNYRQGDRQSCEYQVINFYNSQSESSLNNCVSAEMIAAYIFGHLGGLAK